MIIGIGTDILNISRLHAFSPFRLSRLATRILTANELQFLKRRLADGSAVEEGFITEFTKINGHNRDRLVAFLGVRWTAKEALYKALYPHRKLSWKDIELLPSSTHHSLGAKLHAKFTNAAPITLDDMQCTLSTIKSHVSVSHDGDYVIAMVLVEGEA